MGRAEKRKNRRSERLVLGAVLLSLVSVLVPLGLLAVLMK